METIIRAEPISSPPPSPAAPTRGAAPKWLVGAASVSWRLLVVAAAVAVVALAFWRLRLITLPLVAALFLSTILSPPARWLARHRLPAALATWVVFLVAVGIVIAIGVVLVPGVSGQFHDLGGELSGSLQKIQGWLTQGPFHLPPGEVSARIHSLREAVSTGRTQLLEGALTGVALVLEGAGAALLTLVLTFFFVKDGEDIFRSGLALIPANRATEMQTIARESWKTLAGYVRGTAINGLINALILSLTLLFLGVPLVVPVGILTFIGGFVPLAGGIVSGAIAILLALVTKGPTAAIVVLGAAVLSHNLEGYIVGPLVLGRAVHLHPLAILIALTTGTILGGIIGAFLAVPLVAVLVTVHRVRSVGRLHVSELDPRAPAVPSVPPSRAAP
jgi:predicted PurR-regulated permease PerM